MSVAFKTETAPIPHHFKHHKHKCKLLRALKGQRSARCDHTTHKEQSTLPLGLSRTSRCAGHWGKQACLRQATGSTTGAIATQP